MSTATVVAPSQAPAADVPYDLTIDLFSRMVESGLIPPDRRVFLTNGRLYEKMAKTKAHGYVGAAINRAVHRRLPDGWSLWPESTIVLDPTNAPLPDFALVRAGEPAGLRRPRSLPRSGRHRPADRGRRHQPPRRPDHGPGAVRAGLDPGLLGRRCARPTDPGPHRAPRRRRPGRVRPCRDLPARSVPAPGARWPGGRSHPLRRAAPLRASGGKRGSGRGQGGSGRNRRRSAARPVRRVGPGRRPTRR